MNKTTIVLVSDPITGEEALGRAFNGLAAAFDIKENGGEVSIILAGTGTRWAGVLTNEDHPLHPLYLALKNNFAGVSSDCADVFDSRQAAERNSFPILDEAKIPGTSGLPGYSKIISQGGSLLIF